MRGYYRNPEETQRILRGDDHGRTWLWTGDVARLDEDGFLQILDRKKDMIIRSGLKVYPGKVEQVLRTHPLVTDAAVIGRPDPLHTEAVVAIVVPAVSPLAEDALADELRALCRAHLAPYEVPTAVDFTERIPRSALGKVLKKELRRSEEAVRTPAESGAVRRAA
jgi:long-chain acyl-CoA synthetase